MIEQNKLSIVNQFIWMAENLYPESATKVGMVQCERCGLRFSQFARTGRLGCSDCYTAFASQLPQVLRRVHGAVRHKGRTPEAVGPGDPGRQALDRLRLDLSRAIEREDFETAARLRDEIRALEPTAAQISGRGGGPASSPVSEGGTQ
ncbi:MAG: UvrB/UvrC motif-containing protein [Candidatus Eisenbacteria bacterium]|nr:UvrB/UvrC motif-containing protein [Candidatus Eisenbacteria bacterium]